VVNKFLDSAFTDDGEYIMRRKRVLAFFLLTVFILLLVPCFVGQLSAAGKINCLKCHMKITKGKFVHQALEMGCLACHAAINARAVPHKKTNALARGLSSDQPDLCYGCHDKGIFTKNEVHPAVSMGCTGCHNPHASKNAKLLKVKTPALCFTCHEKTGFTRKFVHQPVAAGDCMTCHSPHSTDEMALLVNKPAVICLQCHPDAVHGQHALSRQLPVSEQAAGRTLTPELQDPTRPGRPFFCGSCHTPHSADNPSLFRFDAKSSKELCIQCHKI
jgi:predicted CXXCH cytochrome family protein